MAFSNLQKKQLNLMIENPKEFLEQCKNGKVDLKSFHNQFFKNGSGIFHLLADRLIIDSNRDISEYMDIFSYVLEQDTRLSIFQDVGRTTSAFKELMDFAKTSSKLNTAITEILLKQNKIYIDSTKNYQIADFVCILAEQGFYKEVDQIITSLPKILDSELMNNLLNIAIEINSKDFLNYVLKDSKFTDKLNNEIGSYFFPMSKPYEQKECGNVYIKCIKQKNYNALFQVTENYAPSILSSGKVIRNEKRYSNANWFRQDLHPLDLLLEEGNKNNFEKFYNLISDADKAEWVASKKGIPNEICKTGFQDIILKNINNLFSENVPNISKLGVYNNLLSFGETLMEPNKYQNIEKILEPLWDKIPMVDKATSFRGVKPLFEHFYSAGNMSDEEIQAFTNIFKKIVERGEFQYTNNLFSKSFFNEPKLVKKLLENGLKIDVLPTDRFLDSDVKEMQINIFEIYLHVYGEDKRKNYQTINPLNIEKSKETLSILYDYNPTLVFNETTKKESILKLAVTLNCGEIFEILSVSDFEKFIKNEEKSLLESISNSNSTNDSSNALNIFISKALQTNMFNDYKNLSNKHKAIPLFFYYFLNAEVEPNLLDKLYEKVGFDINKEINKTTFWHIATTKHAREYTKEKVTEKIHPGALGAIMEFITAENQHHKHLLAVLDVFPDFYKNKLDGENLLHMAARKNAYINTTKLVTLYPELATEANEYSKLPVSYLIDAINKQLKKNHFGYNGTVHSNAKEAFINLLPHSISMNENVNKTLEEQLEKYPDIKENFKDVIVIYEYEKLKGTMLLNNAPSTKKLKL
jgi:hypothetical protein